MKILYLETKMGCAGDMLMGALSELVDQQAFINQMNALHIPHVQMCAQESEKCGIHGTHIVVDIHGEEEHSHDIHANEVSFSYQFENLSLIQQEQVLQYLKTLPDVHHPHFHDSQLFFIYDHDRGFEVENALREYISQYDDIKMISLGHSHSHSHNHSHQSLSMHDITHIIQNLDVSENVKSHAIAIYESILEAESHVHQMPIDQVHFHEVGTIDALVDVVGNCILFEMIGADRILCSPIALGNGMVKCAHGILPVPAPATAYLLQGIPTYNGQMEGELCTPTGAAILKHYVHAFTSQPTMMISKIGYGMGKKDFPAANCVRAFVGESEQDHEIVELVCTIDDQTGEEIGYAIDRLFEKGALDVYTTPVQMKKNRPGIVLTCTCKQEQVQTMLEVMFHHLTTLGIREYTCRRHTLLRNIKTISTPYGDVRIKQSRGYQTHKEKIEYDDLSRIAKQENKSIQQIREEIFKGIKE